MKCQVESKCNTVISIATNVSITRLKLLMLLCRYLNLQSDEKVQEWGGGVFWSTYEFTMTIYGLLERDLGMYQCSGSSSVWKQWKVLQSAVRRKL